MVSSQLGTKCTTFHVTLQTVAVWYAGNKDIAYKYGECYPLRAPNFFPEGRM